MTLELKLFRFKRLVRLNLRQTKYIFFLILLSHMRKNYVVLPIRLWTEESKDLIRFPRGEKVFLLSTASKPILSLTHSPTQLIP
jgi:hypothetical protein